MRLQDGELGIPTDYFREIRSAVSTMLRPSLSPSPRSACGALSIRHYGFVDSDPAEALAILANGW